MRAMVLMAVTLAIVGAARTNGEDRVGDAVPTPPLPSASATVTKDALVGDYQLLGFWAKVKVAHAYYSDPKFVRGIGYAYMFDPVDFKSPEKSEELWDLAKDGKVSFGIPMKENGTVKAISFADLSSKYSVGKQTDLNALLISHGIKYIAGKDVLLGYDAKAPLFKCCDASGSQ